MTRRFAWLLVTTTLGAFGLPGCNSLFVGHLTPADQQNLHTYILPPDPVPVETPPGPPVVAKQEATMPPAEGEPVEVEAQKNVVEEKPPSIQQPMPNRLRPANYEPKKDAIEAEPPSVEKPAQEKEKKRAPLVEALQCILDGEHQEALQHLQTYDPQTQEFYLRVLPTLTIFAKKRLDQLTPTEVAVLNQQLQDVLVKLRPRTELVIDKMCYCEWVNSYGIYKPLERSAFLTSTPERPGGLVQLYVEVRNFASELRDGCHETRLRSTLEVRDAKGQIVWTHPYEDEEPLRTRTRVNDYYKNYSFYVPPQCPPGIYELTVQIVDETIPEARRVARKTIEFRVAPVTGRGVAR